MAAGKRHGTRCWLNCRSPRNTDWRSVEMACRATLMLNRPERLKADLMWLIGVVIVFSGLSDVSAGDRPSSVPIIDAGRKWSTPPEWAVLERQLFDVMSKSPNGFISKYLREDGRFRYDSWGKLDDSCEPFHNWPTFYCLGGDEQFLSTARRQWEVITRRFTEEGVVVDEFHRCDDWMHLGEGFQLFYALCLADPGNQQNISRARKFAGLYLNESPLVQNYDPERQLILCTKTGSTGPLPWSEDEPWEYVWSIEPYGLPFYDLPGIRSFDDMYADENLKTIAAAAHARWGRGDGPVNLAVTSLMLNAFFLTGESKYSNWITSYTDAWVRRTQQNGGILPDNVGLSGAIGEYIDQKWYGGYYGWTLYHGWGLYAQSTGMAAENALLVTGDSRYLDFPRSQIDLLTRLGIVQNDTIYVPHKRADAGKVINKPLGFLPVLRNPDGTCQEVDGWFEFMPMDPVGPAHLWNMSMEDTDLERAKRVRNRDPLARYNHDWKKMEPISRFMAKDHGGHESGWLAYLDGTYPEYPIDILKLNTAQTQERARQVRGHQPKEGDRFSLIYRNPIIVEGLVNLTMGGPLPFYNGGLLMTRVRHFDPVNRRPGLPRDVAALVSSLESDRTVLHLVNLNTTEPRDVIVQAGAYGEHEFETAEHRTGRHGVPGAVSQPLHSSRVQVRLAPGTEITLDLVTKRFANAPSYSFPW